MSSGSSTGEHTHKNDEEMYIILRGEGAMFIEGLEKQVASGDMIVNKRFGTHGLVNTSINEIELLII